MSSQNQGTPDPKCAKKRKLDLDDGNQKLCASLVTPKRCLVPKSPMTTPQKGHAGSDPSPAKRKALYGEIKDNFIKFNNQLQTTSKAALYDLSLGDTNSVEVTLKKMLAESKSFVDTTLPLLTKEDLYSRSTAQKNSCLMTYNSQLKRENDELKSKLCKYAEFESAMDGEFEVEKQESSSYEEEKTKQIEEKESTDSQLE